MTPPAQTLNEVALDVLHVELCAAINDLARSVDVAITRIVLGTECAATTADTDKTECVAEVIRVSASARSPEPDDHKDTEIVLTLPLLTPSLKQDDWKEDAAECEVVDELNDACRWLAAAQVPRIAPQQEGYRDESKIAMRILELQTRFGGLTIK